MCRLDQKARLLPEGWAAIVEDLPPELTEPQFERKADRLRKMADRKGRAAASRARRVASLILACHWDPEEAAAMGQLSGNPTDQISMAEATTVPSRQSY